MILNSDGSRGDRCGGRVPDPDSPLCDGCEVNHRGFIDDDMGFAMMPLDRL